MNKLFEKFKNLLIIETLNILEVWIMLSHHLSISRAS
jgi:hypothetical protein